MLLMKQMNNEELILAFIVVSLGFGVLFSWIFEGIENFYVKLTFF